MGIRSALLLGRRAHLFAGAGVVRGSEAASEWDEVHVKMRGLSLLFPHASRISSQLLMHSILSASCIEDMLLLFRAVYQFLARPYEAAKPGSVVQPLRALLFSVKVSRPYFWLVTLWLYLLPTGQRYDLWARGRFWVGLLYCTMPLNLLCYLMNDLSDVQVDEMNPRKGGVLLVGVRARAAALRTAVPWAVAMQFGFLAAICCVCGTIKTVLWFGCVVLVNWMYNFGPRLSSRYAPLDLICPCGYMLVIPLSCALNALPLPALRAWVHTLFFILRSQLWIQTFDIAHDALNGRQTSAVLLGLRGARMLLAVFLVAESAYVHAYFADWALRSFSLASLVLLAMQVAVGKAAEKPSAVTINATFIILGLGGYGLLVQVWLNGAFNPDIPHIT